MIALLILLASSGLYEQAVSRVLAKRFAATEYILFEAATHRIMARNWHDPSQPIPAGSLMKPLLAENAHNREIVCKPGECWRPQGHGRVDVVNAIAWSCNAWFLQLKDVDAATLIGLRGDWRIAPDDLASAYIRLTGQHTAIREGMRRAVEHGTAQGIGMKALAKTGTAACSHERRGPGDGLVVVLWPEVNPKYLLMVREHGTTGAVTARIAGQMLRIIRDGSYTTSAPRSASSSRRTER